MPARRPPPPQQQLQQPQSQPQPESRPRRGQKYWAPITPLHLCLGACVGIALTSSTVRQQVSIWWQQGGQETLNAYISWTQELGVRHSKVDLVFNGTGRDRACRLRAARTIGSKEDVIHVPASAITDITTLMNDEDVSRATALTDPGTDQQSPLAQLFEEQDAGDLYPSFLGVYKLWAERMRGSDSPWAPWLDILPQGADTGHVLYWSDDEVQCLDSLSRRELDAARRAVGVFFAALVLLCRLDAALLGCASGAATEANVKWAYVTFRQRAWGEDSRFSFIPVADLGLSHAPLCAPRESGGEAPRCRERDRGTPQALLPRFTQDEQTLVFSAAAPIAKGDWVYVSDRMAPPWETLPRQGYVAYAANSYPDLQLQLRLADLADHFNINLAVLPKDHPLRPCAAARKLAFTHSGEPQEQLWLCHSALLYVADFPDSLEWSDAARTEFKSWKGCASEQAKVGFMVWRALHDSAQTMLAQLATPGSCQGYDGYRRLARESSRIARAALAQCVKVAGRRRQEELEKWQGVEKSASADIPWVGALSRRACRGESR